MRLLKSSLAAHIRTKATPSVPAKCTNLKRFLKHSDSSTERVVSSVVESMSRRFWSLYHSNWSSDHLFEYTDPARMLGSDETGSIKKSIDELNSWEHKFACTPKFTLVIELIDRLQVEVKIENGRWVGYEIQDKRETNEGDLNEFREFLQMFTQSRLDDVENMKKIISNTSSSSLSSSLFITRFCEFLNKHFI